ncbi:GntR family transcriptional regulator [Rhodopseudomonas sp. P2A-2r]|uniref:GntR family transcriptional regulator n=1 Tax=unclassified Rhodopseudomonas TaxID=2638247 RepID=UPI002234DD7C|nr:GntR family transcriptional regulator [Rhodopseudomonas sp. P2A-2r]UZE49088.1 GntR family transcriptional regulator [Rhodopseudomonas sp. P2A-2r]
MKDVFGTLDRSSLYETVYSQISLALIEGQLQPDDKVRIRALADQLGVSVTPVRDALLRLVKQGALEMRGVKDIRVPRMRLDQFQEVRLIRLRIEGLAAQLAATKIDSASEVLLTRILEENEAARTDGNTITAIKLNRLFHSEIAVIAGLPTLQELIENMWLRMGPLIAAVYNAGGRAMISHHYEILDALRKRDPVAAESAIQADINATADILIGSGLLLSETVPPGVRRPS